MRSEKKKFFPRYWWGVYLIIIFMMILLDVVTMTSGYGYIGREKATTACYGDDCSPTLLLPFNLGFLIVAVIAVIALIIYSCLHQRELEEKQLSSIILMGVVTVVLLALFSLITARPPASPDMMITYDSLITLITS